MINHSVEDNHTTVTLRNFAILNSGYRHRKFKSKVSNFLLNITEIC